jgi:hypothetical protein
MHARLLEGLDMHGDKWPAVAEHVGTHSVLECITHFLQLPIEDDFLDELERRDSQRGAAPANEGGSAAGAEAGWRRIEDRIGRVPLAGNGSGHANPVMSMVSRVWAPAASQGKGIFVTMVAPADARSKFCVDCICCPACTAK